MAAFITLSVVPNLKYPANPPSVGDPETIGYRTGLYFLMIAVSIATMVLSLQVRRFAYARLGAWNASIAAGAVFIAIITVAQISLPTINEVPSAFPATLLWQFRIAALGMQAILWTTIGLLFGALAERCLPAAREYGAQARVSPGFMADGRA
jgi:predicted cobalt transporter CbtA